jgi:hypothetical protein
MKRTQKLALAVMAASILLGTALAPAAADKLGPGKVESKAEIWLSSKTRFSGFALPAGQYQIQHRVDGSEHSMSFIQLRAGTSMQSANTHKLMPVRVRCRLEPLPAKASRTAFYSVAEGDASRARRLGIKGESMAHVFPMPAISVTAQ